MNELTKSFSSQEMYREWAENSGLEICRADSDIDDPEVDTLLHVNINGCGCDDLVIVGGYSEMQGKVNEAKKKFKGNDLKQQLTSVLFPKKIISQYFCTIWSTKSTSGGMGRKAGFSYIKCNVQVEEPLNGVSTEYLNIPDLRKLFKEKNVVL